MLQQVPLSLTTGSTSNRSGESMGRIVSGPFSYRNADYSLLEMFRLIRFGLSRILKPGGRLLRLYGRPESAIADRYYPTKIRKIPGDRSRSIGQSLGQEGWLRRSKDTWLSSISPKEWTFASVLRSPGDKRLTEVSRFAAWRDFRSRAFIRIRARRESAQSPFRREEAPFSDEVHGSTADTESTGTSCPIDHCVAVVHVYFESNGTGACRTRHRCLFRNRGCAIRRRRIRTMVCSGRLRAKRVRSGHRH